MGGEEVAANYNETTMSDDDNGSLTSRLNDDLRRGPSSFLGRARGGEGGWNVEPDRVGSRAIAKSWECLGQGSPCFSFVASLSFIPLLSLCLSLCFSLFSRGRKVGRRGTRVVNSAAKREDFSAS